MSERAGNRYSRRLVTRGVLMGQSASGRDFLQQTREVRGEELARSSFFDSLHSRGRRDRLAHLNTQLVLRRGPTLEDLLGNFPELKQRRIYAVDGHHLAHACHARRDADQEHVSVNSLYVLCLHTGLLLIRRNYLGTNCETSMNGVAPLVTAGRCPSHLVNARY